jgi:hypothetical protein
MNLKNFAKKLDTFDIYYNYSDDHRIWSSNYEREENLVNILNSLSSEEQTEVFSYMTSEERKNYFKNMI